VRLMSVRVDNDEPWQFGQAGQDVDDIWVHQISGTSVSDVESALSAAIADAVASEGVHGTFEDVDNQLFRYEGRGRFTIQIRDRGRVSVGSLRRRAAEAYVCMHEKAWLALGYSPTEQSASTPEDA